METNPSETSTRTVIAVDSDLAKEIAHTLTQIKTLLESMIDRERKQFLKLEQNRLLTSQQAREYLGGITHETLLYYRKFGLEFYKKGREGIWYRKGDIDDWLASGKVTRHKR